MSKVLFLLSHIKVYQQAISSQCMIPWEYHLSDGDIFQFFVLHGMGCRQIAKDVLAFLMHTVFGWKTLDVIHVGLGGSIRQHGNFCP